MINRYRIFWNQKFDNFWYWHGHMCDKFSIDRHVSVNYYTDIDINDSDLHKFDRALRSGFINRIVRHD